MNMHRTLIVFLLTLSCASALAQNQFSTLEEKMTGSEFMAAGLDKLTPEELAALNLWLRSHSVGTLEVARVPQGDTRGFEDAAMSAMDDRDIIARVVGPFQGWDGNTVFTLDNGQIWKQAEKRTFYVPTTEDAVVRIEKGAFGTWKLSVEGYNRQVKVERIQ